MITRYPESLDVFFILSKTTRHERKVSRLDEAVSTSTERKIDEQGYLRLCQGQSASCLKHVILLKINVKFSLVNTSS